MRPKEANGIAAKLALHPRDFYLDQLWVAPAAQGRGIGRALLAFTRRQFPDEIWLRCVVENKAARAWYEREGFRCEGEETVQPSGLRMKVYRWNARLTYFFFCVVLVCLMDACSKSLPTSARRCTSTINSTVMRTFDSPAGSMAVTRAAVSGKALMALPP